MTEDTLLPFDLPAVSRKKVTADFAGGSISSDAGLILLRAAERGLGLAEALAGCIRQWRDPERVVHTLPAMLRFPVHEVRCPFSFIRAPVARRDLRTHYLIQLRLVPSRGLGQGAVHAGGGRGCLRSCRALPAIPG